MGQQCSRRCKPNNQRQVSPDAHVDDKLQSVVCTVPDTQPPEFVGDSSTLLPDGTGCPFKHGMVYADPYPGYVHGRRPAICKYGCTPQLRKDIASEKPVSRLLREAREFQELFHKETGRTEKDLETRMASISAEVARTDTYRHTFEELQTGARIAWRNAPKCANRKMWNSIDVFDRRDVVTNHGMYEACVEHLNQVVKDGVTKAYITIFAALDPVTGVGPRIWSDQLIRFAGFASNDAVIGDPANLAFTLMVQKRFGWAPKHQGPFEILPLVVQASGQGPACYDVPEPSCSLVDIWHPVYPFLSKLGMKWCGIPAVSNIQLELGGLVYGAVPFNGWFADSEVVRDLADEGRYNMLPTIAQHMGLAIENNLSLWKDKALMVLNEAVTHSFAHADVAMVDHHTMIGAFYTWYHDEIKQRGYCPGNWKWVIPPLASSTSNAYLGLNKMTEYTLKPMYAAAPGWRRYEKLAFPASAIDPKVTKKNWVVFCYSTLAVGEMLRRLRKKRAVILLVYASTNGTTRRFANLASPMLGTHAVVHILDAATINSRDDGTFSTILRKSDVLLVFTASYGQGDPPQEAEGFYQMLQSPNFKTNIPFAVLGFGNRSFHDFCGAATKFDSVLELHGGQRFFPVTRCDELKDRQETFETWLEEVPDCLYKAIGKDDPLRAISSQIDIAHQGTIVSQTPRSIQRCVDRHRSRVSSGSPFRATPSCKSNVSNWCNSMGLALQFPFEFEVIKEERVYASHLLQNDSSGQRGPGSGKDRYFEASAIRVDSYEGAPEAWSSVVEPGLALVRLSLKDRVPFQAGDHMAVIPRGCHFENDVQGLCEALNVDPDAVFVIRPAIGHTFLVHESPLLYEIQNKYTTMRIVLTSLVGLDEPLTEEACGALSFYADNEVDEKCLDMASTSSEALAELIKSTNLRWASVFSEFPSLRNSVPVEKFLQLLPTHRPRLYSVASSPTATPGEAHLIVSRFIQRGQCGVASDFLSRLTPGETVWLKARTNRKFHLPPDSRHPLVLVGAGSGLAPFRSFWQARSTVASNGHRLGKAVLFYGCRDTPNCLLYSEFEAARTSGVVTNLITAISSQEPKRYVQDRITENRALLKEYLDHPNCHVYLCGRNAMVTAAIRALSLVNDEVIQRAQREGRLQVDAFGG